MAPPLLVIEVVSPGEENQQRDYTHKRRQYQDRGIPEYWLIDPSQEIITVLIEDKIYKEFGVFRGADSIQSPTFQAFSVTAERVLKSGQQ